MSSVSHPTQSLRIFVVENHPDTLKYLGMYLEAIGHTVRSASSMEAALKALPLEKFDVLISDIGLPDGSGWDLMEQAQLPPQVYAIAMSGFGMNSDRAKSKAAGYRHHILKPFVPMELEAMLDEAARELAEAT